MNRHRREGLRWSQFLTGVCIGLLIVAPVLAAPPDLPVAVNDDTSVGSNYNLTVGSNETSTISGNQSIDVGISCTQARTGT